MKLLRFAIFVFLLYPLFFNLLGMEEQIVEEYTNDPSEEDQNKSLNFDPKNLKFHQLNLDATRIYKGEHFVGELPQESMHILKSLGNFDLTQKVFPLLVKISGPEFCGKTTLVRHFVQTIKCANSQFLEIGSLTNINEIKETLKSKGIVLKQLPSEITDTKNRGSNLKNIEAIIEAFYHQKANQKQPYIINFMNGLKLKNRGLQKLRESIKMIQHEKIAPLTVFFESRTNGSSDDRHFLDEIIHIYPPTPKDIMAILIDTFEKNGYVCEPIKLEMLSKFQPAVLKKKYTPPSLIRIAEKILRIAAMEKRDFITNKDIEKALQN